ncbi:hypothetical protein SDRG_16909 [Saprolegnia diclina VS20]|uniref:Centrosomal protein of 76 kDa n=1 Tax=Saprolegnia diclina (strain VS20) TaxID=1156394 RepID=T0PSI1_SAPDV|nr:hypothetical protein SDRG_16909 [Saprolegnia diclina VS20]EQC25211.1 hypothetical protein SDRG_16909 [Saprolegnia diclina VS20]|eukprot:XP_008621355.1 hypothetical protein SDRG_16909 [Saprolegnia diclina VS20]
MEAMNMDKIVALRTLIDTKLRDEGVYAQLRNLIQATAPNAPTDTDTVVNGILESDLVQQLIGSLKTSAAPTTVSPTPEPELAAPEAPAPTLQLRLLGGRAFVECVTNPESHRCGFRVEVAFLGHRFQSRVVDCVPEPAFDETFHIPLPAPTPSSTLEVLSKWEALCRLRDPVQFTLLKVSQATGAVEFVAAARVDWRRVMSCTHATAHFPLQLQGPLKIPIGLLDVRLDLLGFRKSTAVARDVAQLLQKELLTTNAVHTTFYQYAKQWWEEVTLLQSTKARAVRIFTEDETHRHRMVCTYIVPLQSRCIATPTEAARFVSLIPFVRAVAIGGGHRQDGWKSLPAFLAIGRGDCEEHALLLASLLLGFGLDAYVVMGALQQKDELVPHTWVLLKEKAGVVLWEAVTGVRYPWHEPHPYARIDCVFNDRAFFVSRQNIESNLPLKAMHLDFHETKHWKSMESSLLQQLQRECPLGLVPPSPEPDGAALEAAVQNQLADVRRGYGYTTQWTSTLSHYLRPALTSYELERTYGIGNLENNHFEMSIKRYVPEGSTFQGCPIFVSSAPTLSSEMIVHKLLHDATAKALLQTHARPAQFGLAIRVYSYPERIVGAWVMLGVVYRP